MRRVTVHAGPIREVQLLQGRLDAEGIPACIPGAAIKQLQPFPTTHGALATRLRVPSDAVWRAKEIVGASIAATRGGSSEASDVEQEHQDDRRAGQAATLTALVRRVGRAAVRTVTAFLSWGVVGAAVLVGGVLTGCGEGPDSSPSVATVLAWAKVAPEQIAEAKKHGVPVAFENELGMKFVLIPAGTFRMGSPKDEAGRGDDERLHEVTLTKPFYMQIHEVAVGEHARAQIGMGPTDVGSRRMPATDMTWIEATAFAARVGTMGGGRAFALPTEAQWEYACRAGTSTAYSTGQDIRLEDALWDVKSDSETPRTQPAPVASHRPNAWGLYDMHGNVWEWCSDYYGLYPSSPQEDPVCENTSPARVMRGGSLLSPKTWMRSAHRGADAPTGHLFDIGLRLVSPLPASVR